jgi:putative MATE family efflux protein
VAGRLPALGVLAAEPLYLLVDTAVVGHLGATQLAGLSVGAIVLSQVGQQLAFLSFGTTARSARLHGAGRRADAVAEGVQATWIAVLAGLVLLAVGQLFAEPIAGLLAGSGPAAAAAVGWLRIALFGAPLMLITMAGNGWMRGVQDMRRPLWFVLAGNGISAVLCPVLVHGLGWGLNGSAVANVVAQLISAALFVRALRAEGVALKVGGVRGAVRGVAARVHRRLGGAGRDAQGVVVLRRRAAHRRRRVRARRGRREVPTHGQRLRRRARLPARGVGVAGAELGSGPR